MNSRMRLPISSGWGTSLLALIVALATAGGCSENPATRSPAGDSGSTVQPDKGSTVKGDSANQTQKDGAAVADSKAPTGDSTTPTGDSTTPTGDSKTPTGDSTVVKGDGPAKPGTATLAWDAPTTNAAKTPLTDLAGFKVYWGEKEGAWGTPFVINDKNKTTHTVTGLQSGKRYYFTVTAFDSSPNKNESVKPKAVFKDMP